MIHSGYEVVLKLVFKNDVFAEINLTNSQISFHFSFLYECHIHTQV